MVHKYRILAIALALIPLSVQARAKPPVAGQPESEQPAEDQLKRDAQAKSAEYNQAVKELAEEIARERAKKLSWLYFPSEVSWVGVRVFYGNRFETRPTCESDRPCLPHTRIGYGAEVFLNPIASLEVAGRVGGVSHITDDTEVRHNLTVAAFARWNVIGLVPISFGWRMDGIHRDQIGKDQAVRGSAWSHFGVLCGGLKVRGATAEVCASLGGQELLGVKEGDIQKVFSALVHVTLLTPALIGW